MFAIKNYHKNVFVEGNILFDTDKEVSFTDIVTFSTFDKNNCFKHIEADKSITDNGEELLYVSNNLICEDDAIYHTRGDAVSYGYEKKVPNPIIKQFNMDNLAQQIAKLNEELTSQVPLETLQVFQKSIRDLKERQIENRSLNIGDKFPDFELHNPNNQLIGFEKLLNGQKTIIAFLRGSWCPYCNLEIRELQNNLDKFKNAKLVVVSPQSADANSEWQKQHNTSFEILSDTKNQLAQKVGIDFELQDFAIPHYENLGIDLPTINQTKNHVLPIPAVYVLDANGTIIYKFVNANYMERINVNELIQQL